MATALLFRVRPCIVHLSTRESRDSYPDSIDPLARSFGGIARGFLGRADVIG